MNFARPEWGYAFILIAGLFFFFAWAQRSKKNAMTRFADEELLVSLARGWDTRRERRVLALFLAGLVLIVLAFMRPQWGSRWEHVRKRGSDILIALDVSNSMLAEDIKPSRLERSKLALRDFVNHLAGDRVGLIVFAGDAYLACPLTSDYNGFNLVLDSVSTNSVQRGGTAIASAIREAKRAFEAASGPRHVLVLITDGEDHEGRVMADAGQAKKEKKIEIYPIGIGTREGELIPVTDASGQKTFLKDNQGQVVKTRLDEGLLQRLAETTGGHYIHATPTDFGLDILYASYLSKFEKSSYENQIVQFRQERFQWFLSFAFAFLFWEALLVYVRPR